MKSFKTLVAATLAALLFMTVVAAGHATRTFADESWFWDEPTLVLQGQSINISAGFPAAQESSVQHVYFEVTVPTNVSAHLINNGAVPTTSILVRHGTYSGHGAIKVSVRAIVIGPRGMATGLKATGAGVNAQSTGKSDTLMVLHFSVSESIVAAA